MTASDKQPTIPQVVEELLKILKDTLRYDFALPIVRDPKVRERKVIEFNNRMRVFVLEKFNGPCYAFVSNFYLSESDFVKQNTCGAIIFFLEEDGMDTFFKALGKGQFDEDDDALFEYCTKFLRNLAEKFAKALVPYGFEELLVSDPRKLSSDSAEGIEIPAERYFYYEIAFEFNGKKSLVVDLVMTLTDY